jgi:hypothetical protein
MSSADTDTNVFAAWRRRPPAFLAHIEARSHGSGVQVDSRHVVTCAHVVYAAGPQKYYEESTPDQRPDVKGQSAHVRFNGFESTAAVIAQHKSLDLVILRLERPRPGVAPPFAASTTQATSAASRRSIEAYALGARREAGGLISLLSPFDVSELPSSAGETFTHVKHHFGAPQGTSGGGVFAAEGATLSFLGIAYFGGEFANTGGFIPGDTVLDFLEEELGLQWGLFPSSEHGRKLWRLGVAPTCELKAADPGLTLTFAAIVDDAAGALPRTSFLSRRVISAREMRMGSDIKPLPGHWRLPAWAATIERADAAIGRFERILNSRFRLPTPRELEVAWRGDVSRIPKGRPLVLSDFRRNELGIDVPPLGAVEWARDPKGGELAIERLEGGEASDIIGIIESGAASYREPCFRLAFDVVER